MKVLGFVLGTAGYALLVNVDWRVAIGVALATLGSWLLDPYKEDKE